ncbi:MAG: outer membrane lipoprotein-sorting protein [Acidobacteria bacterium]|nr:outer membrane lipoprotein-sorting protein [Acidobacteriota bacterium]
MSKGGSNIGGIVIFSACAVIAAWIGIPRYLNTPAASVEEDVVEDEAPVAPKRKASRARTNAAADSQPADAAATETSAPDDISTEADSSGIAAEETSPSGSEEPAVTAASAEPSGGLLSSTLSSFTASSSTGDEGDARTIMEESQRRSEAKFYRYDGLLQSFDNKGKITDKRWTFDRVGSNGRSKAVLRFSAPAEVKGVSLLIHNHPERASDQWMWTPALQRDRRIALQDRSTRFFGTDFSFEDLEERDVEQYDYEMLGDDVVDGAKCWKIETTPKKSRSSHYTRSIAWIRKDNYLMVRLDNFVDDEVVKRLSTDNVENVQGIWTARILEMSDLRRGTRTRLTLKEVGYNTPVNDREFTLQGIRQ